MTDEKEMQQAQNVPEEEAVQVEQAEDENASNEAADASAEPNAEEPEQEERDAEAEMLSMLADLPEEEQATSVNDINFDSAKVSNAQFQHLSEPGDTGEPRNIDLLMDVNLPISIELGRTKMTVSDILSLGPGSVVELSKLAGEPVDVMVNYKPVARGEVVVIDENFGVRITQLLTPEERLRSIADSEK